MKTPGKLLQLWNEDVHEKTAIVCCIFMIAGLFFSRALLSLSMFLMFLNALHPLVFRHYWNIWRKSAFSLLCTGFFIAYLVSGLWSHNMPYWFDATINKLPFVILPFAFLSISLRKKKTQQIIIFSLLFMQLLVIGYSLFLVSRNWNYYLSGYQFSRPIPTTKYNDHIRFSLSLVLSIFLTIYLLLEDKKETLSVRWKAVLVAVIALFVIYLHLLAAKSGLVCLYLGALIFIISKIGRKHKLLAACLTVIITALPFLGYFLIPTFRVKVDYVRYEHQKTIDEKRFDYTLSDAGRMITYDLGIKAIAQHPIKGVGAGDIMDEMKKGYEASYPEVTAAQRFGPINQFMFTALSIGIPLTLLLIGLSFAPLFLKVRNKIYLSITVLTLFISLMVESPLELQFGVFTYLFFMLIWIGILKQTTSFNQSSNF